MKIIERIFKYLENKEIKPTAFEKKIGLSNGYLGKMYKRNADIGESIFKVIIENCPDINPAWLILGQGSMLKSKTTQEVLDKTYDTFGDFKFDNDIGNTLTKALPSNSNVGIPLIPISAMAGKGKGDISISEHDIVSRFIIPEWSKKQVDFLIRIEGNSMYPRYCAGDLIACRKVQDTSFFVWGKVYVLNTDQGAMVKRIFESKKPGYLLCKSDNAEHYPPFDIPMDSIYGISIVIGGIVSD